MTKEWGPNRSLHAGLAVALVAAGLGGCTRPAPKPVKVEFVLAFSEQRANTEPVRTGKGATLYREPNPTLTERDIEWAVFTAKPGDRHLDLKFGPEGAETLKRVSRINVGHYLLFYVDGALLAAPQVNAPMTDGRARLTRLSLSNDEGNSLARRLSGP